MGIILVTPQKLMWPSLQITAQIRIPTRSEQLCHVPFIICVLGVHKHWCSCIRTRVRRTAIDTAINICETNSEKSSPNGLLSENRIFIGFGQKSASDKSPLRTRVRLPPHSHTNLPPESNQSNLYGDTTDSMANPT